MESRGTNNHNSVTARCSISYRLWINQKYGLQIAMEHLLVKLEEGRNIITNQTVYIDELRTNCGGDKVGITAWFRVIITKLSFKCCKISNNKTFAILKGCQGVNKSL